MKKLYVTLTLGEQLASQFPDDLELDPHITVLYIVEIDDELVGAALEAIGGVVERAEPFDIELGEAGRFEHPEEDVAWVGIAEADAMHPLRALRRDMLAALCAAGIGARQTHPGYVPHATIARLPKGEAWGGRVPSGGQRIEKVRVSVDDEQRFDLALGAPRDAEVTVRRAWAEETSFGRPFVGFTVGRVYCRFTGDDLGEITPELLTELVRVFETRRVLDPVTIDWNHGSADGGGDRPPEASCSLGRIERMWIEGDKLWMAPKLNVKGRQIVAEHQIDETDSTLYASPEWVVKASGLTCRRTKEVYGYAQILAVAATPRPAQVASAVSPILLNETTPRAEGAPTSPEALMDPTALMAQMRAHGIPEETIKKLLGDDYVPPAEAASEDEPAGGGMTEGEGEKPNKDDADEAESVAMSEVRRMQRAQQQELVQLRAQLARQTKLSEGLLEQRDRERREALASKIESDFEVAVQSRHADPGQKFAFSQRAMAAATAKLTAKTAKPDITEEELAKLPEVREFTELFGRPRADLDDLGTDYGHGQRGETPGKETLESAVTKFQEEHKIEDWLEAERQFAEKFPQRHARFYREAGLLR